MDHRVSIAGLPSRASVICCDVGHRCRRNCADGYIDGRSAAQPRDIAMRKLIVLTVILTVAASALIASLSASSAVAVPSPVTARTITDLHQPVRIGAAGSVLRRMP